MSRCRAIEPPFMSFWQRRVLIWRIFFYPVNIDGLVKRQIFTTKLTKSTK